MAGIYIHVPFCRQICYYCDFYKTINSSRTEEYLSSLAKETVDRKDYLSGELVNSIYFGGGTPSVLTQKDITGILELLSKHFNIDAGAEITLEANPDDLNMDYLRALYSAGINRLSIGIQSFVGQQLIKMNRRHSAKQAVEAVENAYKAGFSNLSGDLIFGIPGSTIEEWKTNLKQFFALPVKHLSAYHLTYHPGTPFYTWLKKGTLREVTEDQSLHQFNLLIDEAQRAGYEHYEISNFAREHLYSVHNKSYWFGEKYLGLGPSAHSYNGTSRRWNVSHLEAYMKGIESIQYFEEEVLTENDKYNEFILTRLRTKWGIAVSEIEMIFGINAAENFKMLADSYLHAGKLEYRKERYFLTREGIFVSDDLIAHFIQI